MYYTIQVSLISLQVGTLASSVGTKVQAVLVSLKIKITKPDKNFAGRILFSKKAFKK
jgi:hypothetical protein